MANEHLLRDRGNLFENTQKKKPSQPDMQGDCTIAGVAYEIRGWRRGESLELSFAPPRGDQNTYPPDVFRGALEAAPVKPVRGGRGGKDGNDAKQGKGNDAKQGKQGNDAKQSKQGKPGNDAKQGKHGSEARQEAKAPEGPPVPAWSGDIASDEVAYTVRAFEKQGKSGLYFTLSFDRLEKLPDASESSEWASPDDADASDA